MRISDLAQTFRETFKRVAGAALLDFFLAVNPAPASRPRFNSFTKAAYYGKTYETFKHQGLLAAKQRAGIPTDQPVLVMLEFVVAKPVTGKLRFPQGDVDNYAKGPMDIMTQAGTFWADDRQVVGVIVFKRYAAPAEEPGVIIHWAAVDLAD